MSVFVKNIIESMAKAIRYYRDHVKMKNLRTASKQKSSQIYLNQSLMLLIGSLQLKA